MYDRFAREIYSGEMFYVTTRKCYKYRKNTLWRETVLEYWQQGNIWSHQIRHEKADFVKKLVLQHL